MLDDDSNSHNPQDYQNIKVSVALELHVFEVSRSKSKILNMSKNTELLIC
jgi:hypothetical protein